ncbi:MAG: cytochrome c peroxidase [Planctomycetota bacterium]|nr:cytochrome c peroxidase [Planctomycetota bacterium]
MTRRAHRAAACALLVALVAPVAAQTILPPPPVPPGNPLTPQKALLGKALFWDEQLSSSRSMACGTCHDFTSGGSDSRLTTPAHPGPDGIFGNADDIHGSPGVVRHDAQGRFVSDPLFGIRPQATSRKAPSMINAAYGIELFWDGRASDQFFNPVTGSLILGSGAALESQIAEPLIDGTEMSHIGRTWTEIATDIANLQPLALADQIPATLQSFIQGQTYAQLFQQVFGSPGVTPVRIIFAIASYERTLISDQSPYDLFLTGQGTLTSAESFGLFEFQGLCMSCHQDIETQVLATGPVLHDFRNVGVRPLSEDTGRFQVTGLPLDMGRFKVPGLRNVALRAPYFHNGGMPTLTDVVDFYARGGDFHINQDVLVFSIPGQVSPTDRVNLVAFLNALTDPRVAQGLPPFDRPRLWSEGANTPAVTGIGTVGTAGMTPSSIAVLPAYNGNQKFTVGVDNVPVNSFYYLVLDSVLNPTPTVILGQNVYLGQTPNMAFVGLGLTQGSGNDGYGMATLSIPAGPSLTGLTFYGQWLMTDPQGPFGLTVSDAFSMPIF